jgi:hypothetical protein
MARIGLRPLPYVYHPRPVNAYTNAPSTCALGPVPSFQWASPVRGRPRWARSWNVSRWRRASCVPETRRRKERGDTSDVMQRICRQSPALEVNTRRRPSPMQDAVTEPPGCLRPAKGPMVETARHEAPPRTNYPSRPRAPRPGWNKVTGATSPVWSPSLAVRTCEVEALDRCRPPGPALSSCVPASTCHGAGPAPGPAGSAPSGPSWSPTPSDMPTPAAGLRLHLQHAPAFGSSFVPRVAFRR